MQRLAPYGSVYFADFTKNGREGEEKKKNKKNSEAQARLFFIRLSICERKSSILAPKRAPLKNYIFNNNKKK